MRLLTKSPSVGAVRPEEPVGMGLMRGTWFDGQRWRLRDEPAQQ
jgi:hypothetical protein